LGHVLNRLEERAYSDELNAFTAAFNVHLTLVRRKNATFSLHKASAGLLTAWLLKKQKYSPRTTQGNREAAQTV
jgi:hypothetical protein